MSWRIEGPYVPRPEEEPSPPATPPGETDEGEEWPAAVYVPAPAPSEEELARRLRERIRTYPDFPREGVQFRDVVPIFRDPDLFDDVLTRLEAAALGWEVDWVAAVESRGFLLGAPLADRLGLPLAPVRKQGKLPGETATRSYELEYGSAELELQREAVEEEKAVLLVDDLLATGGTLHAAARLLEDVGARVAGMAVLVELEGLGGRDAVRGYNLLSLLRL